MNRIISKVSDFYNKYKVIVDICLTFIVLGIYLYFVLTNPNFQNFNKDEIHAWNIATDLSFFEIIRLMRAEGHTFIWYMLLKPFTHNPDIFFPWIIKTLNFIFVFMAVLLLWFKAPFNRFIKIFMIFSTPLFSYFSILGRCYGVGIFLLFLIAIFYNDRLKKPVLFSVLLFLTANTSFIAALSVCVIWLFYLFEIIKEYKFKLKLPVIILLAVPVSLCIQWIDPIVPCYVYNFEGYNAYERFYRYLFLNFKPFIGIPLTPMIIYTTGTILSLLYFKNNKTLLFSVIFTYIFLVFLVLKVYTSFDYFYLFLIIVLWVYYWINENCQDIGKNKLIRKIFSLWVILLCILFAPFIRENAFWFTGAKQNRESLSCVYKIVPENSIIYSSMFSLGFQIPYFRNKYILKNFKNEDLLSFDSYFNIYIDNHYVHMKGYKYKFNPKYKYKDQYLPHNDKTWHDTYQSFNINTLSSPEIVFNNDMNLSDKERYVVLDSKFLLEDDFFTTEFQDRCYICDDIYIYYLGKY